MTAACAPLRSSPTLQNTYLSFLEIVWAGWFHRSLHEGGTLGRTRPTKFLQSAEYADCRDGPHVRCAGWKPDEQSERQLSKRPPYLRSIVLKTFRQKGHSNRHVYGIAVIRQVDRCLFPYVTISGVKTVLTRSILGGALNGEPKR